MQPAMHCRDPRINPGEVLLDIKNLTVKFPVRTSFLSTLLSKDIAYVHAIDKVSFRIQSGEIFCLVGESGSGKTTLAKTIVNLLKPTSGSLIFNGKNLDLLSKQEMRELRREIQMIFQDPYASLNPHMTVFDEVLEPIIVNDFVEGTDEREKLVFEALSDVELKPPEIFFNKYPHQLSGGQRQRVAIATALVLKPKFIIADEPVSMLDASVRSEVLNLMINLKKKLNLTYLFITHDLAVARNIGDRIAVIYLGRILEMGNVREVIEKPLNPYTKALISVVPLPKPRPNRKKTLLRGEIPSAIDLPSGCRFNNRCPMVENKCKEEEPILREITPNHYSACHFAERLVAH